MTEPSKTQTKLFDYTALVDKSTNVSVLDIDNDGDKDYVFVLGGILYVKKNHTNAPEKIRDTRWIVQTTVPNVPNIPSVPNYFVSTITTPGELSFRFRNALSGENAWKLEFFDKYLEWDLIAMGNAPSTQKTMIDLMERDYPT